MTCQQATGREGPGVAFRLYKEETFQALPAATVPEIQRVSLNSLMLQLKQLNIQQPQDFDFMDKCAPHQARKDSGFRSAHTWIRGLTVASHHCVQAINISHAEGLGVSAGIGRVRLGGHLDTSGPSDGPPPC